MPTPITVPAGYAPAFAVGFSDPSEQLTIVGEGARLPVSVAAPAPAPVAGQSSVPELVGPFNATAGRVVSVTLGGAWEGTVRLLRSTDGGTTKVPLRVGGIDWGEYTSPGCEQAWVESEDGASFYLDIALVSGSVAYRVSQ